MIASVFVWTRVAARQEASETQINRMPPCISQGAKLPFEMNSRWMIGLLSRSFLAGGRTHVFI